MALKNVEAEFPTIERICGVKKDAVLSSVLKNVLRMVKLKSAIVYSPCRLLRNNKAPEFSFYEGFKNWKNVLAALESHENSPAHRSSVLFYVSREKVENRIDKKLVQPCESEIKYWGKLLKRIVYI